MKKILLCLSLLFLCASAHAQSTLVSGTVTDAGGQTWINGTYRFQFIGLFNYNGPYNWTGGPLPTTPITGALDGSGAFTNVSVPSNTAITPSLTKWQIQVCPVGVSSVSGCFSTTLTITGVSQNITSILTPPAILVNASANNQTVAYTDAEIQGPVEGSTYSNYLSGTIRLFHNGVWINASGSGGGLPSGGTVGQAVINTGPGTGTWQDPNVSFTPVNLFTTVTASATHTSANVKNPIYSQAGSLLITFSGLTGVYTGCSIQLEAVDSLGNATPSGSAIVVTPANGTSSLIVPVNASTVPPTFAPFIAAIWNCGAFGSGGTLSLDFAGQISSPGHGTGATTIGQWVQPGQALIAQITAQNGFAPSMDLIVDAKILLPNGQIQLTRYEINPCNYTGNIAMSGFVVAQGGWLQTFVVDENTAGIPWGSSLLNLYIANSVGAASTSACGGSLATSQIGTSLGTWVTGSFLPTGFVGTTGNITHPWTVPGVQFVKTTGNPAAGNDFSFQLGGVAANGRQCITGVNFFLTANATVATRTVSLRIVQATNGLSTVGVQPELFFISPTDQLAGQLFFYNWVPSAITQARIITGNAGDLQTVTMPFTPGQICADAGTVISIASRIHNLQAGDQISSVFVWVTQQHDND